MARAGTGWPPGDHSGSSLGRAPHDFREQRDVGLVGERGPAVAEQRADVLGVQAGAHLTGRERFTNHAEWVSVETGLQRYLPSSLRFLLILLHHAEF